MKKQIGIIFGKLTGRAWPARWHLTEAAGTTKMAKNGTIGASNPFQSIRQPLKPTKRVYSVLNKFLLGHEIFWKLRAGHLWVGAQMGPKWGLVGYPRSIPWKNVWGHCPQIATQSKIFGRQSATFGENWVPTVRAKMGPKDSRWDPRVEGVWCGFFFGILGWERVYWA